MNLVALVIVFFAVVIIVKVMTQGKTSNRAESVAIDYDKIGSVLTPAERSFYGVLNQIVGDDVQLLTKVRVADVIRPKKGLTRGGWQKAFNKIASKHFDFIICKNSDLSVICCIELNDKSHRQKSRGERDQFLLTACDSANLPLIFIPAQSSYSIEKVKQSLSAYIPSLRPMVN